MPVGDMVVSGQGLGEGRGEEGQWSGMKDGGEAEGGRGQEMGNAGGSGQRGG